MVACSPLKNISTTSANSVLRNDRNVNTVSHCYDAVKYNAVLNTEKQCKVDYRPDFELSKYTPYLVLPGKFLWGIVRILKEAGCGTAVQQCFFLGFLIQIYHCICSTNVPVWPTKA